MYGKHLTLLLKSSFNIISMDFSLVHNQGEYEEEEVELAVRLLLFYQSSYLTANLLSSVFIYHYLPCKCKIFNYVTA